MADQYWVEAEPTFTISPSTGRSFFDTLDKRLKFKDENNVVSQLFNTGMKAESLIDNGGMMIQQRVATASTAIAGISTTTRAGLVADRWAVLASVASNLAWAQIDSAAATETSLLARYYGRIDSSVAGKKVMISQFILNSRMAHVRGQKVRLSVKLKQVSGAAGQTYHLGLLQLNASGTVDVCPAFLGSGWSTTTAVDPVWGTNLAAIAPDAAPTGENGTISGNWLNIVATAGWVRSSAVFTVPLTAKNLVVVLFADATGGTTDQLGVTEFQLTQGADLVDFVQMPLDVELVRCQRFFYKTFDYPTVPATNLGVTTGCVKWGAGVAGAVAGTWSHHAYTVPMWKTPTITLFNPAAANAQVRQISATAGDCTSSAAAETTNRGTGFATTPGATAVIGSILGVHFTADAEFNT